MQKLLKVIFRKLDQFWFHRESTLSLGVFRIAFGLFILTTLFVSSPNWQKFYGPNGVYPLSDYIQDWGGFIRATTTSVLIFSNSEWYVWVVFGVAILLSMAFILGIWTRLVTILPLIIWISIYCRNALIVSGGDKVATMLLFFSCFAPLGNSLSLDCLLKYRRNRYCSYRVFKANRKPVWGWRLMQVSIALIYLFAAPYKVIGDSGLGRW